MSSRKRRLDVPAPGASKRTHTDDVNPWTGQKYSSRYYDILKKRMELPVFEQKEDFIDKLRNHQVIVLQGETGSGVYIHICTLCVAHCSR
jgi:pre-mRNA-splicing factor ATP-dependent RNA helicase DHX15/PRP43